MTNLKTTKRALFSSVIALLVCFTMLLGTTFAWFTDSVTSAGNKIVAGTLDVQLLMDADLDGTYDDISNSTSPIFGEGSIAQDNNAETLWEPGKTQVAYLAIKNNGNLDLKYTVGLNVQNVSKDLYEVMEYAIVPDADANNKVTAWNGGNSVVVGTQSVSGDVELKVGETHYFALAIHMDELAGDEYKGGEVNFDLTVLATQLASESDSFGNQYDADAKYPVVETVTVTETGAKVELSTTNVKVTVPAGVAQAGDDYKIEVSNETTETDATTGETTVAFDLTMYKNNEKVSGTTVYAITKNVGAGLFISEVTHNGNALAKDVSGTGADQTWTYDAATGELTIYTASFSPFAVTYNTYMDYTVKLNAGHNKNSVISVSTGSDSLDIVAVNPSIAGYTVYDGDTRIANAVTFRFSNVAKTIDGDTCKVSFDLVLLDENGKELTIKEGKYNPYNNADLRECLWVDVNLLEAFPDGYSVSEVKVNDTVLTASTGDYAPTNGYLILSAGIALQVAETGTFEIILTK